METQQTKQNEVVQVALSQLPAMKIADDPRVHKKFVSLYNQIHGSASGELMYAAEKFHFGKLLTENEKLKKCTPLSLYGAFLDVAVQGLSIDPTKKLCYLVPYNFNVGTRENPKFESRAVLQVSGYGELLMRQRYGQIKYADNPVVVYRGDSFEARTNSDGQIRVDYIQKIPRESDEIIASFIRIERPDGSIEFKVFTKSDIDGFRKFSKDPNSKAWTDGIKGMVEAKTIKHAFKTYPKLLVKGQFSQLQTDVVDTVDIDYTLDDDSDVKPEPFGGPAPTVEQPTVKADETQYEGF